MIILAGITGEGAVAALTGDGMAAKDAQRRTLCAELNGCWSSRRRVIVHDPVSNTFVVLIRGAQ